MPKGLFGDETVERFEARKQAMRNRLIASRGSTYTYKDPDAVAARAGRSIGDDGRITIVLGGRGGGPGGFVRGQGDPTSGGATGGAGSSGVGNAGGAGGSHFTGGGNFFGSNNSGAGTFRSGRSSLSDRRNFVGPRLGVFENIKRKLKDKVGKLAGK